MKSMWLMLVAYTSIPIGIILGNVLAAMVGTVWFLLLGPIGILVSGIAMWRWLRLNISVTSNNQSGETK